MQARQLTAGQGWRWLAAAFALFRKNPAQMTLIVIGYWLIIAFINTLPLVGQVLATISIPAFSVGLMNACRELDHGRSVLFPVLFSGFRTHLKTLLVLGVLYLAASLLALAVSSLADGGLFMQTILGNHHPSEAEISGGDLLVGAQVALVLMTPVIMAWWYAPMLVAWHGCDAGKSLFFSFVACARNWKPFLAYGLCIMAFGALLPGLLLGVLAAAFPAIAPHLTSLFIIPLLLVLAPTLITSFYISYREVFTSNEACDADPADPAEQPPADA